MSRASQDGWPGRRGQQRSLEDARHGIEQARHGLERVRRRLLRPTPEAFESSVPILESAILRMQDVEASLCSPGEHRSFPAAAIRAEISLLRRELAQVNALSQNAARHYQGRASLLKTDEDSPSNYTNAGTPVQRRPELRLVLNG